jgi:hypothetical protein
MIQEYPHPLGKDLKMVGFLLWLMTVMDVYKPIMVKFRKYPYQDVPQGRVSTGKAKGWTIKFQGSVDKRNSEIAYRIREDVLKGRWEGRGEINSIIIALYQYTRRI